MWLKRKFMKNLKMNLRWIYQAVWTGIVVDSQSFLVFDNVVCAIFITAVTVPCFSQTLCFLLELCMMSGVLRGFSLLLSMRHGISWSWGRGTELWTCDHTWHELRCSTVWVLWRRVLTWVCNDLFLKLDPVKTVWLLFEQLVQIVIFCYSAGLLQFFLWLR